MKWIAVSSLALILFALPTKDLKAQPYETAFSLRVGSANGLTWRQFLGRSNTSTETMLVYRRGGARIIGMLTQHIQLGRYSDTYLYVGAGGHAGMRGIFINTESNIPVYGVDGMVGLEYVFSGSGFAVSFDIKPMFELYGEPRFSGNNAGISLRYLIE